MFYNLFVADFEVAMIAYVEIFLFNLVVEIFLLIFNFFFLIFLFWTIFNHVKECNWVNSRRAYSFG